VLDDNVYTLGGSGEGNLGSQQGYHGSFGVNGTDVLNSFRPSLTYRLLGALAWGLTIAATLGIIYGGFQIHVGLGLICTGYLVDRYTRGLIQYQMIVGKRDAERHVETSIKEMQAAQEREQVEAYERTAAEINRVIEQERQRDPQDPRRV